MKVKVDLEFLLEMIFWARRYCDGRSTYAPSSFNRAYDNLDYQTLSKIREWDKKDETLIENGKFWPYAQDGMYDENTGGYDARPIKQP